MNSNNHHSHTPLSPTRRLMLRGLFSTAALSVLTACDEQPIPAHDDAPQQIPSSSIWASPEAPEAIPYNPYPLPNNQFDVLPTAEPLDGKFLERVEKITLNERKAQLMALNGGGKASDEVAKLQSFWLKPFDTIEEIQQAFAAGKLIPLPSIEEGRYFAIQLAGDLDMKNRFWYNLIHPDAYERFNKFVAKVFYAKTGKMLKVGGLVRSEEYQAKLRWSNFQATKTISPHEFGRTIDFSVPEVFNPVTRKMEPTSPQEHEFISRLLTYYEKTSPNRTSWLVENKNAYHGTHYPVLKK